MNTTKLDVNKGQNNWATDLSSQSQGKGWMEITKGRRTRRWDDEKWRRWGNEATRRGGNKATRKETESPPCTHVLLALTGISVTMWWHENRWRTLRLSLHGLDCCSSCSTASCISEHDKVRCQREARQWSDWPKFAVLKDEGRMVITKGRRTRWRDDEKWRR